tara:strand:- start:45 stop:380 length:336 start_codon:yes stop_codon:yes gene_type:complete
MEKLKSIDSIPQVEQSLVQSEPSSFKLPFGATWITNWAYYEGEERLGQVRFFKTRFGLTSSVSEITPTGKTVLTGLDKDAVIEMTYWHLKWAEDGYDGEQAVFDGVVGGKL